MRNDIQPSACLPFEPESASSLQWLPWAVRYKLDGEGLKLSLAQWQGLPLETRVDLVRRLPAEGFAAQARLSGARPAAASIVEPEPIDMAELADLLDCSLEEANHWLEGASPFARYVVAKRMHARMRIGSRA